MPRVRATSRIEVAAAVEHPPALFVANERLIAALAIGAEVDPIVPHSSSIYPMTADFADKRIKHLSDSKGNPISSPAQVRWLTYVSTDSIVALRHPQSFRGDVALWDSAYHIPRERPVPGRDWI